MNALITFTQSEIFGIIILIVGIAMIIITIINMINTNRVMKKYTKFLSKLSNGSNLEGLMRDYIETVEKVKDDNNAIKKQNDIIERNISNCIQRVGLIRYNAFSNTGSDLSFALALLDFENNGIIINGLYSRDNATTTYCKPIKNGVSKYTLSKEEIEAINRAKKSNDNYFINV